MPNNNPQQTTQQQLARAAEGATKVAERLESSAENAASVAIEKVRQVRDEAQSGIEQQRDQIADRIRRIGGVLRSGSQTLSTDDPLSQQLFETAGDRIDRVADYVGNITPGELASDVQSLARRSPGLFFGGSFILGLALGRFAKSTASALSAAVSDDNEEYEQTLRVRRAAPRKRQGQSSPQRNQNASARTSQASAASQPSASHAPQQSASHSQPSSSQQGGSHASGSTGSLPQGVSSSAHATTGSGSAHSPAPNAGPSYGASAASRPQAEPSPASSKAHSVEPGEGSKS